GVTGRGTAVSPRSERERRRIANRRSLGMSRMNARWAGSILFGSRSAQAHARKARTFVLFRTSHHPSVGAEKKHDRAFFPARFSLCLALAIRIASEGGS